MPATTPSALGLLEVIALLFPVVALLLQLQHRAADSEDLQQLGFISGISLVVFLALAFALISTHMLLASRTPLLLAAAMLFMTGVSFLIPVLIALSFEAMTGPLSTGLGRYRNVSLSRSLGSLPWRGENRVEKSDDQE